MFVTNFNCVLGGFSVLSLIHGLDALFFCYFLGTFVIVWFESRDFYLFVVVVITDYGTEKMDDIVGVYLLQVCQVIHVFYAIFILIYRCPFKVLRGSMLWIYYKFSSLNLNTSNLWFCEFSVLASFATTA